MPYKRTNNQKNRIYLLRQGFKRQIYISFHGPAHMTCSPMVRDFFDETGVPILYMDLTMSMMSSAKDLFKSMDSFHAITVGSYEIMGRLEDIPFTGEFFHTNSQTVEKYNDIFAMAYQSGSIGYYFGDPKDHMSTTKIESKEQRASLSKEGIEIINGIVERLNVLEIANKMRDLEKFQNELEEKYPWVPSAFNKL